VRFKATIFLSFVLILLGAYVIYVEIPGGEKKKEAEITAKKLYSFSQSEITALMIRQPDGEIELEHFPDHPDDRWRISRPVSTVADERAASSLASQLERLESTRLVEAKPTELKEFGLDPPAYTVIITLNQVDTEILEIGTENLTGSEVYVRKGEGTSLYLVPAGIKQPLGKGLKEWRRRELFPFTPADVKRIRMTSQRGLVEVAREGDGWAIQKPFPSPGDPSEISNLLGSLVNLRGDDFIDEEKEEKKKEFGAPFLTVNLTVNQVAREASFYKLKGDPDAVYAVAGPHAPIYKISSQSLQTIDLPPSALRDKKVVALTDPQQVEEIEINRTGKKILLVKKEGTWFLNDSSGPGDKKVEAEKVSRLLSDIHGLRAERFVEEKTPARASFPNPLATIRLKGKEGKQIDEVVFGRIEGNQLFARSSYQPGSFLLPKESLDRIPEEKNLTSAPPSSEGPNEPAASPPKITPTP
jgi:hypothetical protein